VVEGDKEALAALLAGHDRFESVDVGSAHLVLLLDLDRVPMVEEFQFAAGGGLPAEGGG